MLIASRFGSEKIKAKMYSRLRLARKYLAYRCRASNGKGHGIHSPFVFDFVTKILNDTRDYPAYTRVEGLRQRLLADGTTLEIEDLGAGSVRDGKADRVGAERPGKEKGDRRSAECRRRSVADIARNAAKPRKLGQLLFRIARHYQPRVMLELGTSLGLSAAYLASGAEKGGGSIQGGLAAGANDLKLLTIEGSAAIAAVAEANFRSLGLESIELVRGPFDDMLPGVLDRIGSIDLAFVDGNHRREPTLRYFHLLIARASPSAVLIFDDIHWSAEMEGAWELIRRDPRVLLTIDLFFIGLVFLREEFKVKQDFVIRF
jgi:predicted O-methyltransferase YrrM